MYQIIDSANIVISKTGKTVLFGYLGEDNDLALAFAYMNRALAYGYLALVFDKAVLCLDPGEDKLQLPYATNTEIIEQVKRDFEKAIDLFEHSLQNVPIPEGWMNGQNYTGKDMASILRFFLARILVYNARNLQQTKHLDWNNILDLTQNGLKKDLEIYMDDVKWVDDLKKYLQYPGWGRVDHRIIHLLDPAYPFRWPYDNSSWDTPNGQDPGQAESIDARFNSDFEYIETNNFRPERGYYHFSHYRYIRYKNWLNTCQGYSPIALVWENTLILAEAETRLGNLQEAIALLNDPAGARKSRGNMPDLSSSLTAQQVLDIIFYERDIELMLSGMGIGFFDMRRRDALQKGTPLHFPVPASFLEARGEAFYTFGGESQADGVNTASGLHSWDTGFYYSLSKPSCEGDNWTLVIHPPRENPPYQYSVDNGVTFEADSVFTGLETGETYSLRTKTAMGKFHI